MALEIPEGAARYLTRSLAALYDAWLPGLRPVHTRGLHVTIKFLGEVQDGMISNATSALAAATQGITPIRLHMVGGGTYPGGKSPRVLWVGLGGEVDALSFLRDAVESSMKLAGFPEDSRTHFRPHVSVGRFRRDVPASTVRAALDHVHSIVPEGEGRFAVESLSLMHSTLSPSGAVYDRLAFAPLTSGGESPA